MPKTIDNDLSATAFTFGFDSAVACATDALDRLHTTAASHERIMVLEVMGRHAGWIALHAGIAGGGDVILIPEIPWTFENVCHKILDREQHGKKFTLIVVAEGAELPDGGLVAAGARAATAARCGWAASATSWPRDRAAAAPRNAQRRAGPLAARRPADHVRPRAGHAVRRPCRAADRAAPVRRDDLLSAAAHRQRADRPTPSTDSRTVDPDSAAVQAARALGISFGDCAASASPFALPWAGGVADDASLERAGKTNRCTSRLLATCEPARLLSVGSIRPRQAIC